MQSRVIYLWNLEIYLQMKKVFMLDITNEFQWLHCIGDNIEFLRCLCGTYVFLELFEYVSCKHSATIMYWNDHQILSNGEMWQVKVLLALSIYTGNLFKLKQNFLGPLQN